MWLQAKLTRLCTKLTLCELNSHLGIEHPQQKPFKQLKSKHIKKNTYSSLPLDGTTWMYLLHGTKKYIIS